MPIHITERLLSWKSLLLQSFWALLGRGPSSRPSPSSQVIYKYDVFISFRGPNTRNSFVDHLYAHLTRKGIFTFKDDKRLEKGKSISSQLQQAIKDSRVSIVVFSIDYAGSAWCLDEMASIYDCQRDLNQTVFSVFYHVDPSHVRNQNGEYGEDFYSHTWKQNRDKVDRWKTAMRNLANSAGWHVRHQPEFEVIENIVQTVIKRLGHKFSGLADDLIGIQPRVTTLESLLKLKSKEDDFRVLGIWGMGGIGKTTLATVLYDRISYLFDACCFIEDVSKIYRDGGAIAVQKQILRQTLDEKNLETYSPSEISGIVRYRLHNIKILVVLDNVDQLEQLQDLAIYPKLLFAGSRIIITTRDKHILRVYGADKVHEVPLLNNNDASELFCRKAFKSDDRSNSCVDLIPQWKDALNRLEKNPDNKIMDVLQISIEGLQHEEKEIFLHIACFFKGEREDYVKRILDACGLHPYIGIQSLVEKSLIMIRNEEIHMHEMLQELGKKIVRHQCPEMPGCWNRLWLFKDFYHVLSTETVTNFNVEAIVLDQKEDVSKCKAEGISKMRNLRLLILYQKNFSGRLNFLSNNLQYFLWHGYPFASLPSKFEPYNLVELNMPNSSIERLWEGRKDLPCLKRMDLSNSKYLMETPMFEGILEIERLDLTGCTNLCQVHPSIGLLTKLAFLSLQNCSSLVNLDFGSLSDLCSLRVLHLSGCTRLENTPDFTGASNVEYLDIDQCTSLSTVHESVGDLAKLKFLTLKDCTSLVNIPSRINTMRSLITLDLYGCWGLMELPMEKTFIFSPTLESLIHLDLAFCNLHEVPKAIGELKYLERLDLRGNNIVSVPYTTTRLYCLAYLNLAHCHQLQSLPKLPLTSAPSVGRYFKTTSRSHDQRSGLYIFDCPKLVDNLSISPDKDISLQWLLRLIKEPRHFRCGFDIVFPWDWTKEFVVPSWLYQRFKGGSVIRIVHLDVDHNWVGFVFCVAFEINNGLVGSLDSSSLPLVHPFYLSFENEYTEERFDMPLNLELDKIDGSKYIWTIYISRKHCHFLKTGAHITFKACPGLMVMEWGLRMLIEEDVRVLKITEKRSFSFSTEQPGLVIDNVEESNNTHHPKIQLPYNWLVTEEDEEEKIEAKEKENNLSNLGF
ncbi:disease resistance protein RPV1-like [Gastrolobium bilobum]|uniref:disease resistance protein RPV1-like n=1 Tax=Gastrolobium bilobum TaxID=150636 RepID=UPI002AB18F1A|nr:disease resistance protein RPV1-like [Gastrolobium bilobum]